MSVNREVQSSPAARDAPAPAGERHSAHVQLIGFSALGHGGDAGGDGDDHSPTDPAALKAKYVSAPASNPESSRSARPSVRGADVSTVGPTSATTASLAKQPSMDAASLTKVSAAAAAASAAEPQRQASASASAPDSELAGGDARARERGRSTTDALVRPANRSRACSGPVRARRCARRHLAGGRRAHARRPAAHHPRLGQASQHRGRQQAEPGLQDVGPQGQGGAAGIAPAQNRPPHLRRGDAARLQCT
jgi:hypothetical protein